MCDRNLMFTCFMGWNDCCVGYYISGHHILLESVSSLLKSAFSWRWMISHYHLYDMYLMEKTNSYLFIEVYIFSLERLSWYNVSNFTIPNMSVMGYGYTCEEPNSFRIGLLPVSIQFGKVLVYRKQTGTHKSCFSLKKKWQKIYKVYPFALKEIISKLCSLLIYIYIYMGTVTIKQQTSTFRPK